MKTVTHAVILNLATADGLFTLVLPTNIAEHVLQRRPFGELLCKLVLAIDHCNIFSSVCFLAAASTDRYLVVLATARSRRMPWNTVRGAKIASLCIWLAVTVAVLPFFTFAGVYSHELQVTSCGLSFPRPEWAWFPASRIYTLVLGFAVPMCTLRVLYADLPRRLQALRLHSGAKALGKAKRKVSLQVLAVLAVGLLCWTPFHRACRGPDHRPAPDATGHHHLLCRHQPQLHQLLPQPLPLGLPGPQLVEEPPPHVPVPRGVSAPPSRPAQP